MNIEMDIKNFQAVNTTIKEVQLDHTNTLQVIKAKKINQFDENTYAKLKDLTFKNGLIEVKMLSRLLPDAPEFARGFIGLAFRINNDDSAFEAFYFRPTNGLKQTDDSIRQNHAWQYFSYPKYTFSYMLEHKIKGFEGPANIKLDQWISLKIVIKNAKAKFYLNQQINPILKVDQLKMGANIGGSVGFFVDIGTVAYFKDLVIVTND